MKLLKSNKQASEAMRCSTQQPTKGRKRAKRAAVVSIRPIDEAAAHHERVHAHLKALQLINATYSESTLETYRDSILSLAAKKAELSKNMRQVGSALAAWHCAALDLLNYGGKLRSKFAEQHSELQRAAAYFGEQRSK